MEKEVLFSGVPTELEILEFRAGGNSYGVDVSDIKEILPYNKMLTPIPNSHPYIEGIFKPRDFLIPIINLISSLKLSDTDTLKQEMIIVTGINNLNIAFHVDSVRGIHRVKNTEIKEPGKKLSTSEKDVIIGIVTNDSSVIELVDFRKIMLRINPEIALG